MNLYRFAPAIMLLLPLSALAGPREDALSALSRCATMKDDAARLACYDSTAAQLQSALSAPPPPPPPPAPVARNTPPGPPTLEQKQRIFGFDGGITGGDAALSAEDRANGVTASMLEVDQIDSISSDISEIAFNSAGRFTVYLGNGQVWQQLSGDESFARYRKSDDKVTVTIERGFVGSFSLQFSNQTGIFKVRRTK